MPCSQRTTLTNQTGFTISPSSGGYATEADCLQACKEGACCEGATCTVKPQCQCQGTGKTFKGVGTTCSPNPCCTCASVLVQIKPAAALQAFDSARTGSGCNGQMQSLFTLTSWQCDSVGFRLYVENYYAIAQGSGCPYRIKLYASGYVTPDLTGPCALSPVANCNVNLLNTRQLSRADFSLQNDTHPGGSESRVCYPFGLPSLDELFPEWVKIGPLSNPLP